MPTAAPSLLSTPLGPVECVLDGEGPPLLAVHGAMGGWDQSLLLAHTLGVAAHRVAAVSRPGYLGTPLRAGRTPAQQAEVHAATLEALGAGPAVVLAVSGGGPSAIELALRHPARVRALVLVSTCAGPITRRPPLAFRLMLPLLRLPAVAGAMGRRARAAPDRALLRSFPDPTELARLRADPDALALFRALTASTSDRLAARIAGTANDIAQTARAEYALERVAVPTLVIHGTADPVVPFEEHGRRLAARIPGAELLALGSGPHAAIFSHRAEVVARVARFLAARAPA